MHFVHRLRKNCPFAMVRHCLGMALLFAFGAGRAHGQYRYPIPSLPPGTWPAFVNGRIVTLDDVRIDEPLHPLRLIDVVHGKMQKPIVLYQVPATWEAEGGALSPTLRYFMVYLNAEWDTPGIRIVDLKTGSAKDVPMYDFGMKVVSWSPQGDAVLISSLNEDREREKARLNAYYESVKKGIVPPTNFLPVYTVLHMPTGTFARLHSTPDNVILLLFWSKGSQSLMTLSLVRDPQTHIERKAYFRVPVSVVQNKVTLETLQEMQPSEVDASISPYLNKLLVLWEKGYGKFQGPSPLNFFYQGAVQTLAIAPRSKNIFMTSDFGDYGVYVAGKQRIAGETTGPLLIEGPVSEWSSDEKRVFFLGRDAVARDILSDHWVWLDPFTGQRTILTLFTSGTPIQVMP